MKISAEGGTPDQLTQLEAGENYHSWPHFLPGNSYILFACYSSSGTTIEVLNVRTGKREVLTRGDYPRYTESGHLLFLNGSTLFAAPFDLKQLEMTSEPVPVLHGVRRSDADAGLYDVSPEGTLVYLRGNDDEQWALVWVDEQGRATPASNILRSYQEFHRLSADGQRVAVVVYTDGSPDIWAADLERDLLTRLTFDEGGAGFPVWSPEGSDLYFASARDDKPGVFRKASDGSGEAERLLETETTVMVRDISPDGRYLAYCPGGVGEGTDIVLLPLAGGNPEPFLATPADEGSPSFSPDGRWIAYDSKESGEWEVYVRPFPASGGKQQVSTEGGFRPRWSQDGRRLFYRDDDAVWVSSVEAQGESIHVGRAERLVELKGIYRQSLSVSPDGKRFLLVRQQGSENPPLTFVFNWFEELKQLLVDQ
jgi:Tol biopolymer transport system component